ncbi:MAG: hypothetical protein ABSB35_38925 [Bryobacteraceae bacterium]
MISLLEQAGSWFLRSGIQEPSGGVARYYRSDLLEYAPVSNEITGYAASTFAYLYSLDGGREYREAAVRAARFLSDHAWDSISNTFPFEPDSPLVFFFDLGIITRGLLAASRRSGIEEFRARAHEAALSMAFDFLAEGGGFHPVISLPEKQPLPDEPRWSRRQGCYQLKSALAWHEVGDRQASRLFESALACALVSHDSFLPGDTDQEKVMDRLHAYCYFLEALLAVGDRSVVRDALDRGVARVSTLLREIAPDFERSDVCAQLLRVRLIAHHMGALDLDERRACEEADRAASYQAESSDRRLDGGFWFGQRRGQTLPFMNPVSTAFCMQALALWHRHRSGTWRFELQDLI